MSAHDEEFLSDCDEMCEECEPYTRAEVEKMVEGCLPNDKEDAIAELLITCKYCDNLLE